MYDRLQPPVIATLCILAHDIDNHNTCCNNIFIIHISMPWVSTNNGCFEGI